MMMMSTCWREEINITKKSSRRKKMSRLILETKEETYNAFFFLGGLETLKVKKEIQQKERRREIFEHFLVRLFSAHYTASRETRIKRRGFLLSYSKNARHSEKKTRCCCAGDDKVFSFRAFVSFFFLGKARTTISFVC